ncbi:phage stabilization protein [Caudoviricetes sp.]|nr:phage stabilization protein [Caudoviricetes sp.]
MKSPFIGGSDSGRSTAVSANRCINLFPQRTQGGVDSFFTFPGLTSEISLGVISSGIFTASNGRCFTVAGSILYEITSTLGVLSTTSRGTVTSATVTRMEDNGVELIIVNGTNGYIFTFATNTLALISDADFPNGCKTISFLDGYFIAYKPSTQQFYISGQYDGATWDSLDFASAEGEPDFNVGTIVSHRELIVFGETSGEVFYNSGDPDFPLTRNQSGTFNVGCAAPYSIAKINNVVAWLGKDETGQGIIYQLNGYTAQPISTPDMNYHIQAMTDISDAIAFSFQMEGNHFYVITFPTGQQSWAFNFTTQTWNQVANFKNGEFYRWEAQEYAFFAGKHLVCDYSEGEIYSISLDVYANGSEARKWLRSWQDPTSKRYQRYSRLVLNGEMGVGLVTGQGSDPQVMLRWSDDRGKTWSTEQWRSMGALGNYGIHCEWRRLGMNRNSDTCGRVWELSGTDPVKIVLTGVDVE